MPLKITMLGAGSIGFTGRLMQDILAVPELQDTVFSLMDIKARNLEMVAPLCRRDIAANKLTLLTQAMLHDPLAGAVCDPEQIWPMTDEMAVARRRWLPQYAGAARTARANLKRHDARGTRVRLLPATGAARLKIRSVKERSGGRAAARAHAGAADKGNMTGSA